MSAPGEDKDELRRLWEADMEYRMSEIEAAEIKNELYQSIREAHANGWTEEEIALECNLPIGRVRAAIAEGQ